MIQFIKRKPRARVAFELRVPKKSFADSLIFIIQDGRKGVDEMSREHRTLEIRQIKGEFFDLSNGGHIKEAARVQNQQNCSQKQVLSRTSLSTVSANCIEAGNAHTV